VFNENASLRVLSVQPLANLPRQVEFLVNPAGQRRGERSEYARRVLEIRFEKAFELQQRLVVETDVVQLLRREPRFLEAVVDGVGGKTRVVLLPREPLLLRRGGDPAVDDQRGGRV